MTWTLILMPGFQCNSADALNPLPVESIEGD